MRDILSDLEQGGQLSDPDPVRRAQKQMLKPLPKRFYSEAGVSEAEGGFAVTLDGKVLRTPSRKLLALPTRAAADLVAGEFAAQVDVINPLTMPVLRLVNAALDGVAQYPDAVADDILRFSGSDLLCYRADTPERLVVAQAEAWDPVLGWLRDVQGATFLLAQGVIHQEQPAEAIAAFGKAMEGLRDPLRLACLHSMTTLTGSAMLALAVARGFLSAEQGWAAAHVDEDWNIGQWGEDDEAKARRAARKIEMMAAASLLQALDQ
ncbi:MAG: ATPase [Notoacmeibacter sp.]|nr:ATPase [Notoacmeibacter sp.]